MSELEYMRLVVKAGPQHRMSQPLCALSDERHFISDFVCNWQGLMVQCGQIILILFLSAVVP